MPSHQPAFRPAAGRRLLVLALGFCSALAAEPTEHVIPDVSALAREGAIVLPNPPIWGASPPSPLCSFQDVVGEIKNRSAAHPQWIHQAETFVRPSVGWLKAYTKWFAKLKGPLHLEYEDQTFDCDKFSRCFVAFADLLTRQQGEARASVCIGWASVNNDFDFAGVSSGNGHALVIAVTTEGPYVVEPQTGVVAALADYPNRNFLREVNF